MKLKKLFLTFVLLTSFFRVFAMSAFSDGRTAAMGDIGSSGCDSDISYFSNPASIYYYKQRKKLLVSASYADTHSTENSYLIEMPDSMLRARFAGNGVAFALDINSYADSFGVNADKNRTYSISRRVDLDFAFAYGYKNFSAGAGLYAGSYSKKTDVFIGKNSYLGDFIKSSIITEYTRVPKGEFVDINAGLMYRLGNFVFSVKSDELLSYRREYKDKLTFENALETMSYGVYFSHDPYAKRGRLKKIVFSAGAEERNVFDENNRSFHFGGELTYQLAREYNISVRAGYYSKADDVFDGVTTFGIGSRLNMFDISLSAGIPIDCWKGEDSEYGISLNLTYLI